MHFLIIAHSSLNNWAIYSVKIKEASLPSVESNQIFSNVAVLIQLIAKKLSTKAVKLQIKQPPVAWSIDTVCGKVLA